MKYKSSIQFNVNLLLPPASDTDFVFKQVDWSPSQATVLSIFCYCYILSAIYDHLVLIQISTTSRLLVLMSSSIGIKSVASQCNTPGIAEEQRR